VTHAYLGLAAFDVVVTLAGYAVLAGLGFVRGGQAALWSVGLAFFTGWALMGVLSSLALTAGLDTTSVPASLAVLAVLVAIAFGVGRRLPRFERPQAPGDRELLLRGIALAGGLLLVLGLGAGIVYSIRQAADPRWDVWAVWLPKAKAIYYFHGLATGLGGFTTYGNPNYPPLIPAITAGTFHFMGGAHTAVLPLQESVLGVMWAAAVVALVGPRVPRWLLFPLLALVTLAPDFWSRLSTVLPDQTVGYLLALGGCAGILWLEERRNVYLVLAAIFIGGATLTKDEGSMLGLLLVLVLIGAAIAQPSRRWPAALALLVGPALIEPWHLWLSEHHVTAKAEHYRWSRLVDFGYLSHKYWRLEYALPKMAGFLFYGGHWTLVPPLVIGGLLVAAWWLRGLAVALAVWLVVGFFGLASVYWIGTYNIYWYVGYSAHRVVATLPLVAGTLLPLLLALALERSGWLTRPATTAKLVGKRDLGEEHAALTGAR
jgi:hypothetical protein